MRAFAIIEFRGDINAESFAEFARHRAARLSIDMEILSSDQSHMAFKLGGDADLLDAFDMALSLGPADCTVRDVLWLTNRTGEGQ